MWSTLLDYRLLLLCVSAALVSFVEAHELSSCASGFTCASEQIAHVAQEQGPEAAMHLLDAVTAQENWSIDDGAESHELAHIVGRVTARGAEDMRSAFLRCPRSFVHGCQHGFFEEILSADGLSMVEAAVEICGEEQTLESFLCYHGIGHGIVMASGNDLRASLRECERLPSNLSVLGCQQGAFMERIDFPCEEAPRSAKWACYINHAPYLLSRSNFDIATASRACLRAEEDFIPACIFTFGKLAADPMWHDRMKDRGAEETKGTEGEGFLQEVKEMRDKVPKGYEGDCYLGAVEHFGRYGKVEEAQEFCSILDTPSQAPCSAKIRDDRTLSRAGEGAEQLFAAFLAEIPGQDSLEDSSFFAKFLSFLRRFQRLTLE